MRIESFALWLPALLFACFLGAVVIVAQSAPPRDGQLAVEVASVKRSPPGPASPATMAMGAGNVSVRANRLTAPWITVRELVRVAYGVDAVQVAGGPPWIASDRFDVEAATTR